MVKCTSETRPPMAISVQGRLTWRTYQTRAGEKSGLTVLVQQVCQVAPATALDLVM